MSSHREAPEISKDPVADNTDTYAFVSPDRPDTVTLVGNWIPLEEPAGGPNFPSSATTCSTRSTSTTTATRVADVTYEFRFKTTVRNPNTFLYNTGPITSLDSPNWNVRQTYSVDRGAQRATARSLGRNLPTPPVQHRAAVDAELHQLANAGDHASARRHQGVRRPA